MFFYHFKECCYSLVYVKRCMQVLVSFLKCDFLLQQPLKRQTLRNISIFNKLLYDVCELQNSVNEMLLSTTPFVSSFFEDLEISSLCIWVIWGTDLEFFFLYCIVQPHEFTLTCFLSFFFFFFNICLVHKVKGELMSTVQLSHLQLCEYAM